MRLTAEYSSSRKKRIRWRKRPERPAENS